MGRGATVASSGVGGAVSFAGSLYVSLGALVMIALLGLPALATRSKIGAAPPAHLEAGGGPFVDGEQPELLENEGAAESPRWGGSVSFWQRLRAADVSFFGLNYILWVVLALGFNVSSKTYMRETGNPVALLAIQGWVGVTVISAMNFVARCRQSRRRSSRGTSDFEPPSLALSLSPSSSSSAWRPWMGNFGPKQAMRVRPNLWQAGLLHSGNAILTSWSILAGGVAATHALKALEPVAAAGFSRWLLGSTLPRGRAASVAIIVLGLAILMLPFHLPRWVGGSGEQLLVEQGRGTSVAGGQDLVVPAVVTACACCFVALRNVILKKSEPPSPPPAVVLLVCSVVSAAVGSLALLVPWLPCSWEWAEEPLLRASGLNAALCFVGYNLASFNLLSELSPVGHAVGNASKRVCLFASGLLFLGEEDSMSPRQLAGASVAFLGLASYNLAGTY